MNIMKDKNFKLRGGAKPEGGSLIPKRIEVSKKLCSELKDMKMAIDAFIYTQVKEGDLVEWKAGRYSGRRARVDRVCWDESLKDETLEVSLTVQTYKLMSNDFLQEWDPNFYEVNEYFKVIG